MYRYGPALFYRSNCPGTARRYEFNGKISGPHFAHVQKKSAHENTSENCIIACCRWQAVEITDATILYHWWCIIILCTYCAQCTHTASVRNMNLKIIISRGVLSDAVQSNTYLRLSSGILKCGVLFWIHSSFVSAGASVRLKCAASRTHIQAILNYHGWSVTNGRI